MEGKKEELYESSSDMNLENRQLEEQIHELRDSLAAIAEEIKSLEQENTDRNAKIGIGFRSVRAGEGRPG